MKIARRCPRCRRTLYHWVKRRLICGDLVDIRDLRPEKTPVMVSVDCADCGHTWKARLSREERGFDE